MQIIRNETQLELFSRQNKDKTAVTIGNFDGVHAGHRNIIKKLNAKKIKSVVVTFYPHTSYISDDVKKNCMIDNLANKIKIFLFDLKIDYLVILPFNEKIINYTSKTFVENVLLDKLNLKYLLIGYDFRFGKNREGNYEELKSLSNQHDFEIEKIDSFIIDGEICSSSLVRNYLKNGEIRKANKFLGRNFSIAGRVSEGNKLATKLNFPTANLKLPKDIVKIKYGVYKTKIFIPHLNETFDAITNFGVKPTINKNFNEPIFENHIFNFNENLYGKKICVEFLEYIRDEMKFNSISELQKQIERDVAMVKINI